MLMKKVPFLAQEELLRLSLPTKRTCHLGACPRIDGKTERFSLHEGGLILPSPPGNTSAHRTEAAIRKDQSFLLFVLIGFVTLVHLWQ